MATTDTRRRRSFLGNFGLRKERDVFLENVAMLLKSGMDIGNAVDASRQEIRSRRLRGITDNLQLRIDSGDPLWQALRDTDLMPEYVISLIRIGEKTGRLDQNMQVIVRQQVRDHEFQSRLKSALMYPVFVFSLTIIVGLGVAWFVLPRLSMVFGSLKLSLPFVTRVLLGFGEFLNNWGSVVVPASIVILAGFIYAVFFAKKTQHIGQTLLLHIPGVGRLIREVELARFGFLTGNLLTAGIPIDEALQSLIDATTTIRYRTLYEHLRASLEAGGTFQKAFAEYPHADTSIPTPVQRIIAGGEQSGQLPQTFLRIGETYEARTDTTTKNLIVMLEPILLVIVWVGVFAIALAVLIPIYSIIGSLR